jgi:hypothetical protein
MQPKCVVRQLLLRLLHANSSQLCYVQHSLVEAFKAGNILRPGTMLC